MTDLARNAKARHLLEQGLWLMWNRAVSRPELEAKANRLMEHLNATPDPPFFQEASEEALVKEYMLPTQRNAYNALYGF